MFLICSFFRVMSPAMGWKNIYRDMAFCPCKDDRAARLELHDSLLILRRFLDGQSGPYEAWTPCAISIMFAASRRGGLSKNSGGACVGKMKTPGTRQRSNASSG